MIALGYVMAPDGQVPAEGQSLWRSKRGDYVIDDAGCWIWQKAKSKHGYPSQRQHRDYWSRANGPIPADHDVHHLCKNPSCINPEHLEAIHIRDHDVEHFLHERTILTLEQVAEIRAMAGTPGVSATALAAKYGVSRPTIHRYWRGARWLTSEVGEIVPPPAGWPCASPGCSELVYGKRHKKYCSPRCRGAEGERRRRAGIRAPGGSRSGKFFAAETEAA